MRKLLLVAIIAALLIGCVGCGSKPKELTGDEDLVSDPITSLVENEEPKIVPMPEIIEVAEEPEVVDELPEGMVLSKLTGLPVDAETVNLRPYAVMINNLKVALPQSGIEQADIMYETLAEGGITRLMALFQNFDAEKIGPVRSCRDYYLDMAFDSDAIYVHFGASPQGYTLINNTKANNIDGISYDGTIFWRDKVRYTSGLKEHSAYTSAENLKKSTTEKFGFETDMKENFKYMLDFLGKDEELSGGEPATELLLPFSSSQQSKFTYDEQTGEYLRFQNANAHIDVETGNQLMTKNIIVQYADMSVIPGDTAGRLRVGLISSGTGVLVTEGKRYPITWSKTSHTDPVQYKTIDGEPIKVNPGKTWICVFPSYAEIVTQ